MIDMVKAIAALPDDARKTMLGERLRMFAEMAEPERLGAMREMVSALSTLPRSDQKRLISTRMAVLLEFPDATRGALLRTHMQALQGLPPAAQQGELEIVNELMDQMPEPMRAVATEKMGEMLAPMLHQVHLRQGSTYGWCPVCQG